MNYDQYAKHNRQKGRWPVSKPEVYADAYSQAIEDASRALGMTPQALRAMVAQTKNMADNSKHER